MIIEDDESLNRQELINLTLSDFLNQRIYAYDPDIDPVEVLSKVGIAPDLLKHSQLDCLVDLPLPTVYSCLRLFVQWVDQGVYDFCNLPLTLKVHLSETDRVFFERDLRDQWTGLVNELEAEVKQMIEILKHSENDIIKKVSEQAPTVSFREL